MTKTVSLEEAKTQLQELTDLAKTGVEVVLTQEDRPVARLQPISQPSPPSSAKKRIPGLHRGEIWVSDDFDEPLPDEFWL